MSLEWSPLYGDENQIVFLIADAGNNWWYTIMSPSSAYSGWCVLAITPPGKSFFLHPHITSYGALLINYQPYCFSTREKAEAAAERHQRLLLLQ